MKNNKFLNNFIFKKFYFYNNFFKYKLFFFFIFTNLFLLLNLELIAFIYFGVFAIIVIEVTMRLKTDIERFFDKEDDILLDLMYDQIKLNQQVSNLFKEHNERKLKNNNQ